MFWNSTIYPKQINHRVYQIHKEGGVVNIFWQLDDIFEPPGRNELIVWKTDSRFFFLPPHTSYGRVRLARFARVRLLRHALPISLLILREKKDNDCFAVYPCTEGKNFLS